MTESDAPWGTSNSRLRACPSLWEAKSPRPFRPQDKKPLWAMEAAQAYSARAS